MDSANLSLWAEADARPSPQYGLLLKLAVYNRLWIGRGKERIGFAKEGHKASDTHLNYQFEFLFDIYWNDLRLLDGMITKLVIPLPDHQRYPLFFPSESENLKTIQNFLYPFGPGPEDALGWDRAYLSKLECDSRDILGITADKLDQFTQLSSALKPRSHFWQNSQPSPYAKSLSRWSMCRSNLQDRFFDKIQQTTEYIKSFLKRDHRLRTHGSEAINETELAAEIGDVDSAWETFMVLFAVSGSGKTRSMERLLSQRFGFYFQACYAPLHTQGLHSGLRTSGSKDTLTLGRMIKYAKRTVQQAEKVNETSWVTYWLQSLIYLRHHILNIFVKEAEELKLIREQRPALWYKLQISDEYDLFDDAFQLLCLLDKDFDIGKLVGTDRSLYYCVDEAQEDTSVQLRTFDDTVSLLSLWARAVSVRADMPVKSHTAIFSGTSLRTTDAVAAISDRLKPPRRITLPQKCIPTDCIVFSSFPAVRDDEQFKTVMIKHTWRQVVESRDENTKACLGWIIQHARPLYGRPGWLVRYLEQLKGSLPRDAAEDSTADLDEEKVRKASDETVDEVKRTLKNRLQDLQFKGKDRLMEDLCRVVVWSDLTDRPTHFWNDIGPKMIEEAFAVVRKVPDGNPSKRRPSNENTSEASYETSLYMLEERLALDAAKEYILDSRSDLVQKYLGQYLQEHANTTGDLGKPAEYFLAWSLDRAFTENSKRLSGSGDIDRSTRLLEVLSSNRELTKAKEEGKGKKEEENQTPDFVTKDDQPRTLNLSGYTLTRGIKIGHTFDNTVPLVDWMRSVRLADEEQDIRPNATFYLPEERAGPDLMFALHKKSPEGREDVVLCLLQLKCGGAELQKGIMRTDLSNAYKSKDKSKKGMPNDSYLDKNQALEDELKAWSISGHDRQFKILRVLVTAAVPSPTDQPEPVVFRGTSCVEYFIRCDARETELLFGREFKVLLNSLKSKDEGLSTIYKKINGAAEDTDQTTTRVPSEERKKKGVSANVEGGDDDDEGMWSLFDLN